MAAADLFDDGIPELDLGLDDEGEDTYEFNLGVETGLKGRKRLSDGKDGKGKGKKPRRKNKKKNRRLSCAVDIDNMENMAPNSDAPRQGQSSDLGKAIAQSLNSKMVKRSDRRKSMRFAHGPWMRTHLLRRRSRQQSSWTHTLTSSSSALPIK